MAEDNKCLTGVAGSLGGKSERRDGGRKQNNLTNERAHVAGRPDESASVAQEAVRRRRREASSPGKFPLSPWDGDEVYRQRNANKRKSPSRGFVAEKKKNQRGARATAGRVSELEGRGSGRRRGRKRGEPRAGNSNEKDLQGCVRKNERNVCCDRKQLSTRGVLEKERARESRPRVEDAQEGVYQSRPFTWNGQKEKIPNPPRLAELSRLVVSFFAFSSLLRRF